MRRTEKQPTLTPCNVLYSCSQPNFCMEGTPYGAPHAWRWASRNPRVVAGWRVDRIEEGPRVMIAIGNQYGGPEQKGTLVFKMFIKAQNGHRIALVCTPRYRSRPWPTSPQISSGALLVLPNGCIALPQAYNPHNEHRRIAVQSNEVYPPPSPPRQDSTFVVRRINATR